MSRERRRRSGRCGRCNFALALLAISLVFYYSFQHLAYHLRWDSVYPYRRMFVQGWLTTIEISAAALVLSTADRAVLGAGAAQRFPAACVTWARFTSRLVRGTPLLVQILIFFYVVADAIGREQPLRGGRPDAVAFQRRLHFGNHPGGDRERRAFAIGIGQSHRADAGADVSLRHLPASPAADVAAAGGPICLAGQGFLAALHHRHQRVHLERRNGQRADLQHAGKLPAAGRRVSCLDTADFALDAAPGAAAPIRDVRKLAPGPDRANASTDTWCWTVFRCRWRKSTRWRWWGRRAAANRPCCESSAGWNIPIPARWRSTASAVIFEEEALLRHRRTVGTVFQAFNLFPHLTALQNITLPLEKVHGHRRRRSGGNRPATAGAIPAGGAR